MDQKFGMVILVPWATPEFVLTEDMHLVEVEEPQELVVEPIFRMTIDAPQRC